MIIFSSTWFSFQLDFWSNVCILYGATKALIQGCHPVKLAEAPSDGQFLASVGPCQKELLDEATWKGKCLPISALLVHIF